MGIITSRMNLVFKTHPSISLKRLKLSLLYFSNGHRRPCRWGGACQPLRAWRPLQVLNFSRSGDSLLAPVQHRPSLFGCWTLICSLTFQEAIDHPVTGLPWLLSIQCLFINRTLFKNLQRGKPKSWLHQSLSSLSAVLLYYLGHLISSVHMMVQRPLYSFSPSLFLAHLHISGGSCQAGRKRGGFLNANLFII